MRSLPEETQLKVRDITNQVVIPVSILVALLSVIFNSVVVYTVARTRSLQRPPLLMLCSLAMTDILYSIIFISVASETLEHDDLCLESVDHIRFTINSVCLIASLGNVALISRDRYLAVRRPHWYRSHVTSSRVVILMCWSWFVSGIVSLLFFLPKVGVSQFALIGNVISLLYFFACLLGIILSYLGIYCTKTTQQEVIHIRATLEREKRMTNTVGLILLALLITFLPGIFFPLILNANGVDRLPFRPFYTFLLVLNGFLNPLLNFGRSKQMRKALRRLMKYSHQVEPRSNVTTITQKNQRQHNQVFQQELPRLHLALPLPE